MALQILVENQENIPEGMEEYYKAQDSGKYILDVEGVDNHPDVHGLKSAYQKEKANREQAEKQYKEVKRKADLLPGDDEVDQDTLQQIFDRLKAGEDLLAPPDKNKLDPTKIKADIEKRYQKQLDELNSTIKTKDQMIRQSVIDSGLTSALAKNKVTNPTYQRAAKRLIEDQIKIKEEDGNVSAFVETDMGEIGLDQFVQNWTSLEEGSAFVDGNTGSGARGAGGLGTPSNWRKLSPTERLNAARAGKIK